MNLSLMALMSRVLASGRERWSWACFDFANSSYTTVIITVLFSPIFTTIIIEPSRDSRDPYAFANTLWAVALAISYLMTVFSGPFFGALTDFRANKKTFLFVSYSSCIILTASLYFIEPQFYLLAFFLVLLSNYAFCLSENFISSFLPFLGPPDSLGRISGYAWALGYIGGMSSLLLIRFVVGESTAENYENLRWTGPLTALFFLIAGLPTFLFVKEPQIQSLQAGLSSYLRLAYHKLKESLSHLRNYKDLCLFLLALFFTMAGLSVVIAFAFIYGKQEVKLTTGDEALAFVLTQISAAAGAFGFGWIQDRIGSIRTFKMNLCWWLLCVFLILSLENIHGALTSFGLTYRIQDIFLVFAVIAGSALGSTQSAGRALVALFSPPQKAGEFFGLWGISSKMAAAFGLLAIAWLQNLFGLQKAFLALAAFFALALLLCFFVNEQRGKETALRFSK